MDRIIEYLVANTDNGDFYVDRAALTTLPFYTGRGRLGHVAHLMDVPEVSAIVEAKGLGAALYEYNVIYEITKEETLHYYRYADFFVEENLIPTRYRRTDLILSWVLDDYDYQTDLAERQRIATEHDIPKYFRLETEIDGYRFFRIVE